MARAGAATARRGPMEEVTTISGVIRARRARPARVRRRTPRRVRERLEEARLVRRLRWPTDVSDSAGAGKVALPRTRLGAPDDQAPHGPRLPPRAVRRRMYGQLWPSLALVTERTLNDQSLCRPVLRGPCGVLRGQWFPASTPAGEFKRPYAPRMRSGSELVRISQRVADDASLGELVVRQRFVGVDVDPAPRFDARECTGRVGDEARVRRRG